MPNGRVRGESEPEARGCGERTIRFFWPRPYLGKKATVH